MIGLKKSIFKIGEPLKSDTCYYANKCEYHIYPKDTVNTAGCGYTSQNGGEILTGFFLDALTDVTIDLGGATLIFHGRIAPFIMSNCKNITLKNFSIDYDRPFYTQGEILEVSNTHLKLKIADGFPYRVEKLKS